MNKEITSNRIMKPGKLDNISRAATGYFEGFSNPFQKMNDELREPRCPIDDVLCWLNLGDS
ncbi:MAG: hypothetical protein C3F06_14320 [Candidatus Methanoperedenaceae archaeon]|nr:MAG: hypothetical protein C3F06_14320 [Candidatus Methanoperedenaceae archaeon]